MGNLARHAGMSTVLLGTGVPLWTAVTGGYGRTAGRRFAAGMAGTIAVQQALVGAALATRRGRAARHNLTLVDLLTLTRGCSAAALVGLVLSGVRDRRGMAGWIGWVALLYGAIVCDWLDGPIARHLGTSEEGALFDLEADSWLTLCAAGSAVRWGDLPAGVVAAPLLRYLFLADSLRFTPYADVHRGEDPWVRRLGIAQMLLFIAALAPFGGRATRLATRVATPVHVPVQLCGLLLVHLARRRR